MKFTKTIAVFLLFSMLISFTGCTNTSEANLPTETKPEQTALEETVLPEFDPIEDTAVLEQLNQDYIYPLSYCNPKDWKTPEEIFPDNFAVFYLVKARPEPESKTEDGLPNYPQEEVESFVQKYFDVDTELMRTAQMYDAELQSYHTWGIGNAWESRVVSASTLDDCLKIDYEIFADLHSGISNVTHGYGTVLMQKNPDNNEEYKFISNDYHILPEPECMVIGESR